jgi:hypothetical protein
MTIRPLSKRTRLGVLHAAAEGCCFPDDLGIEKGQGRRTIGPFAAYPYSQRAQSPRRELAIKYTRAAMHGGGRHRAEPTAGAPTSNTSGSALLDADPTDPPEVHNHLVTAALQEHPAGGSETPILIHTMNIGMPVVDATSRSEVMSPCRPRCGRSSDSDDRILHIAGQGQPAGPRNLTVSDGAGRGTSARARLNRVKGGDLLLTGPSRAATIRDVPLEVGHACVNRQR